MSNLLLLSSRRRSGAAPPAFPASPYLFLVGDADSLAQNTDGTTAPTATDDPVKYMLDRSGNGRHFRQSTTDRWGRWTPPSGGARGRVKFGATNRHNLCGNIGPVGAQTWGIVFKLNATPGSGVFWILASLAKSSGFNRGELYVCNSGGYQSIYWRLDFTQGASGNGVGFSPTLDTGVHTLLVTYDGSESTSTSAYQVWYDGVPQTPVASGSNTGSLTRWASVGASQLDTGTISFPLDGEVSLLSVYDRVLTSGEVTAWHDAVTAQASPSLTPVWSPTTPAEPALWIDPQVDELYQDGGTTLASSPGDPIALIRPRKGLKLSQGTGSARLTRSTIHSKVACLGDGSDDRVTSFQTIEDAACTVAIVYKYGSSLGASTRHILAVMGVAGSKTLAVHVAGASASLPYLSWQLAPVSSTAHVGANVTVGDTDLHTIVIKYLGGTVTDTASWKCWVDGVAQTVVTRAAITPSGYTSYGARSSGTSATSAALGDFLAYAEALSDTDCEALHTYLAARYAP